MKAKWVLSILLFAAYSEAIASQAIAVCRTSGLIGDRVTIASLPCGSNTSSECLNNIREAFKQKYGQSDAISALNEACDDIPNGLWYADDFKIEY